MKNVFLLTLFLLNFSNWLYALNEGSSFTYYVKVAGGTGDGLSEATAWNYDKLNASDVPPGSTILFKRGDIFYGKLAVRSGTTTNGITYSSYGVGANPVITGLKKTTSWTSYQANIYYTEVDRTELNVVTFDGKIQSMGRYPKTGYLTYTSHSGNNSITGSTTLPFDPTGAEVVIRKIRQVTDRHTVTSYANNVLGLSTAGAFNTVFLNNTSYQPQDGNGYFIQASLNTLTDSGDWYYDKTSHRLYMYFGVESPTAHEVKLSESSVLCQLNNVANVTFQGLDFEGANRELFNCNSCASLQFINCNFRRSYGAILADNGMTNLLIRGGSISDIVNSAIIVPQLGNTLTIDSTSFTNIGVVPGAGGSGDAMQLGIWLQGTNLTVANCSINNVGYHGIVVHGNNTLVEHNYINNYGLTKDDCGGVYEFQFGGITHTNKIIRKNIILNGLGVAAGAPFYEPYGQAAAIYLDANVNNVKVYDNILAHGSWGGILLVGVGSNNEVNHNLTYNFSKGLLIYNFSNLPIRNTIFVNNTFVAKTSLQYTLFLQMYANDDPAKYGTFNRNIYARPVDDSTSLSINREYTGGGGVKNISLSTWQATYAQDSNSTKSMVTTNNIDNLRFEYNDTNKDILVALDNVYSDVTSLTKMSSVKIPAYSGSVLVKAVTNISSDTATSPCISGTATSCNNPGPCNTFQGTQSGCNILSGVYNSFFGTNAGFATTTGGSNTFIGAFTGVRTTTGNYNTFIGYKTGNNHRTGYNNTALGNQAGFMNLSGNNIVLVGDSAGFNNNVSENTFLGSKAGYANITGGKGTFVGYQAGFKALADSNTFLGYQSGYSTTTGRSNLFIGISAGGANVTGNYNTYIGTNAGSKTGMGNNNVYLGYNTSGDGDSNTFLGTNAGGAWGRHLINATAVGAGAQVTINDALVLGNNVNVGIGTSAPANRLDISSQTENTSGLRLSKLRKDSPSDYATDQFLSVNETGDVIKARCQLRINQVSDWSDYVFSSHYVLRPLDKVEQFIQQCGHLPGVPSAAQMVEQGVDLTKLNAMLLGKIEELTLYMIKQEKVQRRHEAIIEKQQIALARLMKLSTRRLSK